MSVNISVSGSTLKECHEQILALANEIMNTSVEENVSSVKVDEPVVKEAVAATREMIGLKPQFPIAQHTDVDSRGIPYDTRIHSSNREQSKDGVWRRRRGVEQSLVEQVEAELMGKIPAKKVEPFGNMTPEQYEQHVAPPKVTYPTTEVVATLPEMPNVLAEAHIPATPAPTFAQPLQPAIPPNTYNVEMFKNNLFNILNDLVVAGKINHDWINAQKPAFGGKEVVQWTENQAACESLFEAFVSWGFVNKL